MTRAEILEEIRITEELTRRKLENRLSYYRPYSKQLLFHNLGLENSERLFMAGNQLGKCVSKQTLIDLADGSQKTAGELYQNGEPFQVKAWDGEKIVDAWAVTPIKKPAETCVRVWMKNGEWFECALNHRVLTSCGFAFVETLLPFWPALPAYDSGCGLLTHISDVQRLLENAGDYQGRCQVLPHSNDGQPLSSQDTGLSLLPLLGDVQIRNQLSFCGDGLVNRCSDTLQQCMNPPSSLDVDPHFSARFVEFSGRGVYKPFQQKSDSIQSIQPHLSASSVLLRSSLLTSPYQFCESASFSLVSPFNDGNHVIAYQVVSSQEIYDFTVPRYENYITAGVVHHNTVAGGAEWAMHATGRYPDNWQGAVFNKAPLLWAGSVTGESTRDNPQRILVGPPPTQSLWGQGLIPKDSIKDWDRAMGVPNLLDNVQVKWGGGGDVQADTAIIAFKAYEKGREKWQGPTVDGVWFDEEPPTDIYTEGLTRTNNGQRGQFAIITFTPLLGMSEVVRLFIHGKVN